MTTRGLRRSLPVASTLFTLAALTLVTVPAAAQPTQQAQPTDDASRAEAGKGGDGGGVDAHQAVVPAPVAGEHTVNPGGHRVEGVSGAAGGADARSRGGPAVPGAGGRMRTGGWATLGAGGAGLAVGIVTALVVRSKKNHLDSVGCGDGGQMCPGTEAANVDSYNSWRPVPSISLLAGAMLAGAGVYLLATTPSPADASAAGAPAARRRAVLGNVRVALGPGGTWLTGEF